MKELIIIITILIMTINIKSQEYHYAIAKEPAPILNTPDFKSVFGGADGKTLKLDDQGLVREMEFIALPGTVFELLGEYDWGEYKIFKVLCSEYQYDVDLYADSRFLELKQDKPEERKVSAPNKDDIYKFLDESVGNRYFWGGNYCKGIDKMLELYKPSAELSQKVKQDWIMKGSDCSGLMYEATNGYIPRNTSKLVNYGEAVEIAGLTAEQIAAKCKALDLIVWAGHVIYVYDENTTIQSSLSKGGVLKLGLIETLKEVMSNRKAVNDYNSTKGNRFVIRRWFKEEAGN